MQLMINENPKIGVGKRSAVAKKLKRLESKVPYKSRSKAPAEPEAPKSVWLIFWTGFFILLLWFLGVLPWTIAYVRCGEAPIIETPNIMGSGSWVKPGEKDYSPAPFNNYYCWDDPRFPLPYRQK